MPLSIKTKQVASVTCIVGLAVVLLSAWYVASLASVRLEETQARAELIANAVFQRAFEVVRTGGDPVAALQNDGGLQSILQASIYSDNVIYAEIVDTRGVVIAHSDPANIGSKPAPVDDLTLLLNEGVTAQVRAIYTPGGRSFEFRKPLLLNGTDFGTAAVGVSTLLLQKELGQTMRTPLVTAAAAIIIALVVAMLLAQITLRPIHVIKSGLARLGRGELDVKVELPEAAELADIGDSFKAVSARLAADRSELEGQRATLESVVENLEDAVALFAPNGTLLFANPAMRPVLREESGPLDRVLAAGHPYRVAVEAALARRESLPPSTVHVGGGERLLHAHPVKNDDGELLGVMVVARNLTYLSHVENTLSYSRKLAALSRLSAGIAHEVKNPLNATMIHLELLKMQLADSPGALEHLAVIAAQVRRLDDVVQGFLKFTRPEDLQLQPVAIGPLLDELMPIIRAEASKHGVEVRVELGHDLPPASADSSLLQQAFLNLAINACQAMPHGGRLRICGVVRPQRRLEISFEDTGVGISPENLAKIFDLYFTTKDAGSGIGLSLVYRTIQLHDGDVEVQSVPGRGTTFRVILRQADRSTSSVRQATAS